MSLGGLTASVITVVVAIIGGVYTLKGTNKTSESQVETMFTSEMKTILQEYKEQVVELREEVSKLKEEIRQLREENEKLRSDKI